MHAIQKNSTSDPMLDVALSYIAKGWPVFPCRSADEETVDPTTGEITVLAAKTPLTPNGFRGATKNERIVRELWRRNPGAMVGIPTGETINAWVLDIDTKHDGQVTLAELEARNLKLPRTAISSTANNGKHYFFKHVEGVRNRGALGSGIDVRGSGGYVIAAGSVLDDGRSYSWIDDIEPADAPDWLLSLVLPKPYEQREYTAKVANNDRYVERAIQAELDSLASEPMGNRNNKLNDSAFALGTFVGANALSESEARSLLQDVAHGWGRDIPRSLKTIESGLSSGIRSPRHIPEPSFSANDNEPSKYAAAIERVIETKMAKMAAQFADVAQEALSQPTPLEAPVMQVVIPAKWQGKPIPKREWYVQDLIPDRNVTLLSGDGGLGKSLAAVQIGIAGVLGAEVFGITPSPGGCFYLGAEDDADEFQRRMADVLAHYRCGFEDLGDQFRLAPLAGTDATLALPDKTKTMQPTAMMHALIEEIEAFNPALVVLDTSADLFGGEEINRTQVRQFVGMLRKIAMGCDTAVLLLSHPSVAGMASGSGLSGSTAWNNSVRSRLYLTAVEGDDDARLLTNVKANYGKKGAEIKMRWEDGLFVIEDGKAAQRASGMLNKHTDAAFIKLLSKLNRTGQRVGTATGANYAPKVMAEHIDAKGLKKDDLKASMQRLLEDGLIKIIMEGPASKQRQRLIVSSEDFSPKQG